MAGRSWLFLSLIFVWRKIRKFIETGRAPCWGRDFPARSDLSFLPNFRCCCRRWSADRYWWWLSSPVRWPFCFCRLSFIWGRSCLVSFPGTRRLAWLCRFRRCSYGRSGTSWLLAGSLQAYGSALSSHALALGHSSVCAVLVCSPSALGFAES